MTRIGGAAGAALFVAAAMLRPASAQPAVSFTIPAQPLDRALKAFADVAGVDMLYESAVVSGKSSAPVTNRSSRDAALAAMLRGTELDYRFTSASTVLVFPVERPPVPSADYEAAGAPRMTLRTLHFRTGYRIGGAAPDAFLAYGRKVQTLVDRTLKADPEVSAAVFTTRLALTVRPDGSVEAVTLGDTTGPVPLDSHIARRLAGLALPAPPRDIPQPIRFEIRSRR